MNKPRVKSELGKLIWMEATYQIIEDLREFPYNRRDHLMLQMISGGLPVVEKSNE